MFQLFNSFFDQYIIGWSDELVVVVECGFNLFMGKVVCGICYFVLIFSGLVLLFYQENELEVFGVLVVLDFSQVDSDMGCFGSFCFIDEVFFYQFFFKIMMVCNVVLIVFYMYNGVYFDFKLVFDFYNKGGGAGLGIELEY